MYQILILSLSCSFGSFSKLQHTNTPDASGRVTLFPRVQKKFRYLQPEVLWCAWVERLPILQISTCHFPGVCSVCLCCRKQLSMIPFSLSLHVWSVVQMFLNQSKDKDKYCLVLKYHSRKKSWPQDSFSSCDTKMSKSWYKEQASKIQMCLHMELCCCRAFPPCLDKLQARQAREALMQSCQQPQLLRLWTRVKSSSITNTKSFVFSALPTEVINSAVKDYYGKTQSAVGIFKDFLCTHRWVTTLSHS